MGDELHYLHRVSIIAQPVNHSAHMPASSHMLVKRVKLRLICVSDNLLTLTLPTAVSMG